MAQQIKIKKHGLVKTPTWIGTKSVAMDLYLPENFIDRITVSDLRKKVALQHYVSLFGEQKADLVLDMMKSKFGDNDLRYLIRPKELDVGKRQFDLHFLNGFYVPNGTIIRIPLDISIEGGVSFKIYETSDLLSSHGWRVATSQTFDEAYTGKVYVDLELALPSSDLLTFYDKSISDDFYKGNRKLGESELFHQKCTTLYQSYDDQLAGHNHLKRLPGCDAFSAESNLLQHAVCSFNELGWFGLSKSQQDQILRDDAINSLAGKNAQVTPTWIKENEAEIQKLIEERSAFVISYEQDKRCPFKISSGDSSSSKTKYLSMVRELEAFTCRNLNIKENLKFYTLCSSLCPKGITEQFISKLSKKWSSYDNPTDDRDIYRENCRALELDVEMPKENIECQCHNYHYYDTFESSFKEEILNLQPALNVVKVVFDAPVSVELEEFDY